MPDHTQKSQDNKNQSVASEVSQLKSELEPTFQLMENRAQAGSQRRLQALADNSQRVAQLKSVIQLIDQTYQAKKSTSNFSAGGSVTNQAVQKKSNGLPENLKSGVENLSGMSMDDVKVHRNSDKPAQLQANAYAQGTDIHLAPGQEEHLPHEAWHVAQQKQGRVKPTVQQMEFSDISSISTQPKVAINDNPGLEKEADVMGKKALQYPVQQKLIEAPGNKNLTTAQLQGENPAGARSFEDVKKTDQGNAAAESKLDPGSKENKKKLEEKKSSGENMGEGAQIKLEGELTTKAKLNRFIGNESTYSKLLRRVEDFSKSKKVEEKQAILKELKPMARAWLADPAHAQGTDQNEELKRQSLQRFLDQTTSNYPVIIENYKGLQNKLGTFFSDPITNRNLFPAVFNEYQSISGLVSAFKTNYPPSLNLLYLSEMEGINAAEQQLTKSGTKKGPKFDTGFGFSVTDPEAAFNLSSGTFGLKGNLELAIGGVLSSSGSVTVEFDRNAQFKNIIVEGESCKFAAGGVEIELTEFSYNFTDKKFVTESAVGSLELMGTQVSLAAKGASIADGKLDYESLEGKITGTIDTGLGLKVNDPFVKYIKGQSIEIKGALNLDIPDVTSASGGVTVVLNNEKAIQQVTINDGACSFSKDGISFEASGIGYDSGQQKFTAAEASGSLPIFGVDATLAAKGVSMSKAGNDFEELEGSISGTLDTGLGLKVKDPSVTYVKNTSIEVKGGLDLAIPNLGNAAGEVTVLLDNKHTIQDVKVENGAGEATLAGITLNLTGVTYDHAGQQFGVETAKGGIKIFGQQVNLTGFGISMNKSIFDFERIEGDLPDADFGFFSLKGTKVSYNKSTKAFGARTSYSFNMSEAPAGFKEFTTSGEVDIFWSPEGEKYYSITDGQLGFKLLEQSARAKKFDYNSKDNSINVSEFELGVNLPFINQTFSGSDISISKAGLDFRELKTTASGEPVNVKIFTITPKEYSIQKEGESLGVKAHGSVALSLPDYLGVKASGGIEGNVGVDFTAKTPTYEITSGDASVSMPNPLNKLGEVLGDNWSSSRFEISAGIPVFPGVSAIFGIYMQFGASFANQLMATLHFDREKKSVLLETSTNFGANVEGGVFGGIQGGSQLLLALALLLRAAGNFNLTTGLGYSKEFPMEEKPAEKKIKDDPAFTYNIHGEVKAIASLDIVATALYFFQKRFSLVLGEKSLGEFEYSNTKKSDPEMGGEALASKEMLEEQIPEDRKAEASGLTLEQLLDLDSSYRFKKKEKKEAIEVIESAEAGREAQHQEESQKAGEPAKFNNVPLANLQFYHQFIDKRCNWDNIYAVLAALGPRIKTKAELSVLPEEAKTAYLNNTILKNIELLGKSSNIAQAFVAHYDKKVAGFSAAYPTGITADYRELLSRKLELLIEVERMKKNFLHSGFWGDEAKQMKNINSSSWFGSRSNYEKFAEAYETFNNTLTRNRGVLKEVEVIGQQTASKLVKDHQKRTGGREG